MVRHENVKDWRREVVLTFRVERCDTGNDDRLRDEESTMRISYYVLC